MKLDSYHLQKSWRRRTVALTLGCLAVAVAGIFAGPGIAHRLGMRGGTANNLPPSLGVDLSSARSIVSMTMHGARITAWTAPTTTGYRCVFVQLGGTPNTPDSFSGNGGGACSNSADPAPPPARSLNVQMTPATLNGQRTLLLVGTAAMGSSISRVDLSSNLGDRQLQFADGVFLGELPTDSSGTLAAVGGPYVVVGYDRRGAEVSGVDLNQVVESATPPAG